MRSWRASRARMRSVLGQFTLELFGSSLPGGPTVAEEFGIDERQKRFVIARNIFGGCRDT